MALDGELQGVEGAQCDCGTHLELGVYSSAAGYYLGYWCDQCGPWSRESEYFRTRRDAEIALEHMGAGHLRTTGYRG